MKRIALAAAILASTITAAHADDAILRANNQATFSVGTHTLNYRELDNYGVTGGGDLDSEKGTQAIFELAVKRQGTVFGINDVYTAASVSVSHGNTDYDGYLQGMIGDQAVLVPFKSTTSNTTTDVNLKVGKGFRFGDHRQAQVTPYVRYAFHNWVRDLGSDYGYRETYSHHEIGAGVMGQYAFTNKLVGMADVNVSRILGPKMSADGIADFSLKARSSEQFSLGVDYAVTRQLHVNAAYRLTMFKYGQSNISNDAFEPNSKTTDNTVLIGIGYAF